LNNPYPWIFTLQIFGLILYVILTNEGAAKIFFYVGELAKANIRKNLWWLLHNPGNPVIKYMIYRKNLKLAKKLKAEFDKYYEEK
tara:strand:+ start:457 stop:711 length:255 start_codon:yes stop_codon:yes gene_type:complete